MKAFTFLIVIAISIHAWVGLWIVSTDYIKPVAIRNIFQAFVLVICVGIIVWAGMIFWG
jgi:succinate dehydrogenase / fumarate reductase membrane anchor subunit